MAAAEHIPSPPTYRFRPTKRELVTFYLLPRARGQDPFPGVVIEDDAAGSTLPWDLFARHGVGSEDEAYFLARAGEAAAASRKKPGGSARQDRGCDGGVGVWKTQSSRERCLRVRGERVRVHVSNLNLHMGKGKSSGGSVGWVMHEYTVAAPACPAPVKICHIAFSGHGRKRMRVPDGRQFRQSPILDSSDLHCFPAAASASASASEQYPGLEEQVPTTEQQDMAAPQQLSAGELEFWSSIGVDVQSNGGFEQEQPTGVQSGFEQEQPTGVQSNFEQEQPTGTGVQSSWVAPSDGAMATGVQSSYAAPSNGAMATGLQSSYLVPSNGAMATGVQSSYLAPSNSAMAGDADDFCRSILGVVPTNCAALDFGNMTTRTLGGGCSLICQ